MDTLTPREPWSPEDAAIMVHRLAPAAVTAYTWSDIGDYHRQRAMVTACGSARAFVRLQVRELEEEGEPCSIA